MVSMRGRCGGNRPRYNPPQLEFPTPRGPHRRVLPRYGGHAVHHRVIGKIGEWMTESRQLPVQYGEHLGLGRMKDHIVATIVAMDDRDRKSTSLNSSHKCASRMPSSA